MALLDLVAVDVHTPSQSVASHEAVQVAMAGLKDDYREALHLRYITGLPVTEVASRMNRTDRAVQMLCHRGLQKLRAALDRSSAFLSKKA